jgi:hypothetical protein
MHLCSGGPWLWIEMGQTIVEGTNMKHCACFYNVNNANYELVLQENSKTRGAMAPLWPSVSYATAPMCWILAHYYKFCHGNGHEPGHLAWNPHTFIHDSPFCGDFFKQFAKAQVWYFFNGN